MLKLRPESLVIILFNIVPVIGVAYYDWAPFEMFWLFWMETLIIAFFNTTRVLFSQGMDADNYRIPAHLDLNYIAAIRYLIIRIIIFLFYSLFIIVFIGILGSTDQHPLAGMSVIFFGNKLFNLALVLTVCSQLFYLIKYFFMNRAYYFSSPKQYAALFDGRQIVIHIAVVLGGVGTSFMSFARDGRGGAIWIISVFCLLKCIFELYFASSERNLPATRSDI